MEMYKKLFNILLAVFIMVLFIFSILFLLNDYNAHYLQTRGFFINQRYPDNPGAFNFLQNALELRPYDWHTRWYLTQIHFSHGNFREAKEIAIELLEFIDLPEIRIYLYNTLIKLDQYDDVLRESFEIYSRYGFHGAEYTQFSPQMNNLIEFRIIQFIVNNNTDGLKVFLRSIFEIPHKDLPFEHFRGILFVLEDECNQAVEYINKYHRLYINKQLLAFYAYCLEKAGPMSITQAKNLIKKEYDKKDTNIISHFMVNFYESRIQ